jgi:hypothetical protein
MGRGTVANAIEDKERRVAQDVLAITLLMAIGVVNSSEACAQNHDPASDTQAHIFTYGDFNKTCQSWTDGCRVCSRDAGCSNVGIACLPKEIKCVLPGPESTPERHK